MAFRSLVEAQNYASRYYSDIAELGTSYLIHHHLTLSRLYRPRRVLDFGCGPTVYVPILFESAASEVFLWDINPHAKQYVTLWKNGTYNDLWLPYCRLGPPDGVSDEQCLARMERARAITTVLPDFSHHASKVDLLCANFSLESTSQVHDQVVKLARNLVTRVVRGGIVSVVSLLEATSWNVSSDPVRLEAATSISGDFMVTLGIAMGLKNVQFDQIFLARGLYTGFGSIIGSV